MKKQKKQIIALISATVMLLLFMGVTLAYLGAKDEKQNTMKIGTNIETIQETFTEPETQKMMDNQVQKTVTVQNTGSVPCFVRVYAEFSDSRVAANAEVKNGTSATYSSWEIFKNNLKYSTSTDENWTFISTDSSEDAKLRGYFYYKKVVEPQGETPTLFTNVKVNYTTDPTDTNIDKITDFEIIVYSETVQTTETNASAAGTVFSDADWLNAWKSFLKVS